MNLLWTMLLFVQIWPGSWQIHYINSTEYDHFGIHGLWPNYNNNSWPQYCNTQKLNTTEISSLLPELKIRWTNFENDIEFLQHEWSKHGTCAEELYQLNTQYKYFSTGLKLRHKYNLMNLLTNNHIYPSLHKTYEINTIKNIIQANIKIPNIHCRHMYYKHKKIDIIDNIQLCLNTELEPIACTVIHPTYSANICENNVYFIPINTLYQ